MKLRREEAGLGSEEPISIPTMLKDISEAYPEVRKDNCDYMYTELHPVGLKISWDLRLFTSVCLLLKLRSRNS